MYTKSLAETRGSSKFSESREHLGNAADTIVNTMLEVALPGFLCVDYDKCIQAGAHVRVRHFLFVFVCFWPFFGPFLGLFNPFLTTFCTFSNHIFHFFRTVEPQPHRLQRPNLR